MANPILPTNGTHQLVERYTQEIIALKRKQNVIRSFFNTDYVGDPRAGAVKFAKRDTEVSVGAYDVADGASLGSSATEYVDVIVAQNLAVNELIDGYEAAAVPDNLIAQRLESAAFSMGRKQEIDAITILNNQGTAETDDTETAAEDVYEAIVASIRDIKKLGIPKETLVVAISDETEAKLLSDQKYVNTASNIGSEAAREGVVNRIAGVNVVVSSNLSEGWTGDDAGTVTEWIVFSTLFAATAEEWMVEPTINDLLDGAHIGASALQGRVVYQDVLLRPEACRVKTIAPAE